MRVEPAAERQAGGQRRGVFCQRLFVASLDCGSLAELPVGSGDLQPAGDRIGSVLASGPIVSGLSVTGEHDLVFGLWQCLLVQVFHVDQRFPIGLKFLDDDLGRESGCGKSSEDPSLDLAIETEGVFPVVESRLLVAGQPRFDPRGFVDASCVRSDDECLGEQF